MYYVINEQTKDKDGYFILKNITTCMKNPKNGNSEIRQSTIELFGRAIKVTIYYSDIDFKYICNNFSESTVVGKIIQKMPDEEDVFLYNFNNIVFVATKKLINILTRYSDIVEKNIDYFLNEYQLYNEQDDFLINEKDINSLSGIEFEVLCKQLMQKMGFEVQQTKASGDGGIDLIATNHQPFLNGAYIVQCKRYTGSVGEPIIRDLYGVVCSERANKGILITTGHFTNSAIDFAKDKQIELIDGDKLNNLLEQNGISINNTSLNNNNNIPPKSIWDILDENLLVIDEIKDKMEYLQNNPSADSIRAALIEKLITYAYDALWISDFSQRLIFFSEIYKQIELYKKHHDKRNKRTSFLLITHSIFKIQCLIFEGEFVKAFNEYRRLMTHSEVYAKDNKNSELINNLWLADGLYRIAYSIIQISLLYNNQALTDSLYTAGLDYIKIMKKYFQDSVCESYLKEKQIRHAKKELSWLDNINRINSFCVNDSYLISLADEYTYNNADYSSPHSLWCYLLEYTKTYNLEYSNDTLFITNECGEDYAQINNISDIINKSQYLL